MKILLLGKNGQIGSNLAKLCQCTSLDRHQIDLSYPDAVYSQLENYKPEIIINAAAYTAVDLAETERKMADNINNLSVREIARYCADNNILLVYYSTDYVFDGSGEQEFAEDNTANLKPLNYYGVTKLAGEKAIQNSGCEYMILRTSWVYSSRGNNFVKTILKQAALKFELQIVSDQVGSPTYANDIAKITLQMLAQPKKGIYHLVPEQKLSWNEFAAMIIDEAKKLGFKLVAGKIIPISSEQYQTKAKRPLNSRLSTSKLKNDYKINFPPIMKSLSECLEKIKGSNE